MINNRQAGRRRGRGGQRSQGGNPGRGPESGNRIDNRARGNAAQLHEKYKTLARDAQMQGDRVNTEYYLQFADHYFRVLAETRSRFEESQPRRGQNDQYDDGDDEDFDGNNAPMADDRVDQYGSDRQERQERGSDRGGDRNVDRNADRGGDRGGRDGNRDQRDMAQDGNRDRDRGRTPLRSNGNGYANDGQLNGNRMGGQRDAAQREGGQRDGGDRDRQPRRSEGEPGYPGAQVDDFAAAEPVAEADRPRRGRPRRAAPVEEQQRSAAQDGGDEIAAIVDRLPPALSLSASDPSDGEEKPRRRRGRPPAGETTQVS